MIFNYLETERDHRTSPQSDTYQDEVRTLFVSGLPSDVKQRELHLLFRAYKGKYNFRFNFLLRIGTIKSLSVDSVPHHATDAENQLKSIAGMLDRILSNDMGGVL